VPSRAPKGGGSGGIASSASVSILIAVLAAALYFGALTSDHTMDAVIYAANVEHAAVTGLFGLKVFNPAHVLHTVAGALLTGAALKGGLALSGLTVLQVLSATGGAVMAGLLHRVLVRWTGAPWTATAGAAALAVSGGVWAFAVQGEPNLPSLALAAGALIPLTKVLAAGRDTSPRGGWGAAAGAGLLLGLSAALHLTLGTLWIALLAAVPWRDRRRTVLCLTALGVAAAVLAAAYLPRGLLLAGREGVGPLDLVTFSGESPYPSYLGRTPFAPAGQVAATVAGFAPAAGGPVLTALALAGRAVPVLWLAALALALVRSPRLWEPRGRLLVLAGAWFLANVLLYGVWAERNFEFSAFLLVPLGLAGTLGLALLLEREGAVPPLWDRAAGAALGLGALAAGLAVGLGTVGPARDPAANPVLVAARMVEEHTRPEDHVLVAGGPESRHKVYVPYFAGRRVIVPDFFYGPSIGREESEARLRAAVRRACRQGDVYSVGHIAAPDGIEIFEGIPYGDLRRWVRSLEPRPVAATEYGTILWRLHRCPS